MRIAHRNSILAAFALFAFTFTAAHAQMAAPPNGNMQPGDAQMQPQPSDASASPATPTDSQPAPSVVPPTSKAGHAAAQALVDKAKSTHVSDTPLNPTERAQQMLNRFTFGPRPGEVQAVAAMGAQKWFEQQLHPDMINDKALDKRIANDYPALALTPAQLIADFPSARNIDYVLQGKQPYPSDPIEAGLYEMLAFKRNAEMAHKDANGNDVPPPVLTNDQLAQKKVADQATAARVAGALFVLPKQQRMPALVKMPVEDRIAFAAYVSGDQKRLLLADFTPREREIFSAMASNANASGIAIPEMQQAKMVRAVLSEQQLQEVMTDFWFNHFNIYINKDSDQYYTPAYERDVIRAHALGKFHDLLLATAESPAMMVYLDNNSSIGPDSPSNTSKDGKHGTRGLNENYAREVMELHTLSVNGGYTQADVTQLAKILTGWTVDHPEFGGPFLFNPKTHEPGTKQWLGQTVKEDGQNEGLHALETLAASPKTAHFISWLIAQRFVADNPPPALVDRMAKTYLSTDGDISAVLRTLVASPEFNSHRYFRNKVKTPMEFVASTFRSTGTDPSPAYALVDTMRQMGMSLYQALPPTGYYITAEQWMNSVALIDRLNFAIALTSGKVNGIKFDTPKLLAMELMAQPAQTPSRQAKVVTASAVTPPLQGSGTDMVVTVLENGLLGGGVSAQTNNFLHAQANQPTTQDAANSMPPANAANSTDTLNRTAALVMGSPEFQMR